MKYILLLHKNYLNTLIFIHVNNFYILTFFTFLHFSYVEVNFHSNTLRRSQFSFQDPTEGFIFILRPYGEVILISRLYGEVNFHFKILRWS